MDLCEPHRVPRKYGIRSLRAAEQVRRRSERVRQIRPRAAWNRGKKRESKLSTAAALSVSSRQSEILELLSAGLSNSEIGKKLGIAERTIKFHLCALYKKSATKKNRVSLVLWHLRTTGALAPAIDGRRDRGLRAKLQFDQLVPSITMPVDPASPVLQRGLLTAPPS